MLALLLGHERVVFQAAPQPLCMMPASFIMCPSASLTTSQYPLAIFYFTGSDEFNKAIRRKAIDKGFHLNEYMLR